MSFDRATATADEWAGRARMARARRDAGCTLLVVTGWSDDRERNRSFGLAEVADPLDDIDREALRREGRT